MVKRVECLVSYQKCKKYALKNKIKTKNRWADFVKDRVLPLGIPRRPSHIYQNKGWNGWPKFLNNGNERIKPRSFESGKAFAQKLNLQYKKDWDKAYDNGKIPKDIPKNPYQTWKNEWQSWGDFLGSGTIAVTKARDHFPIFSELKELVQKHNIKSTNQYFEFTKTQRKIGNTIPSDVIRTYPDFKSWDDFFNRTKKEYASDIVINKYIKDKDLKSKSQYRKLYKEKQLPENFPLNIRRNSLKGKRLFPTIHEQKITYEQAREWARTQNISSVKEWTKRTKRKDFPKRIPKSPMNKFKKKKTWISWTDFLGNKIRTEKKLYYASFENAREYARSLNLKKIDQWRTHIENTKTDLEYPSFPDHLYDEWNGWSDFFGTEIISNQDKEFRSFYSARRYVQKLNLKSSDEWFEYSKSNKIPKDIPASPGHVYRDKGWKGTNDWLGTPGKNFWGYRKAHRFAMNQEFHGQRDWEIWCKSKKRHPKIPTQPQNHYSEWKGWRDWLYGKPRYRSFEDAKRFVRKLKLKTIDDWRKFCYAGKKPKDIPFWVDITYREIGWKGFPHFLGSGPARVDVKYTSYENAKKIVQKLKIKTPAQFRRLHHLGKIPNIIPRVPSYIYGDPKKRKVY